MGQAARDLPVRQGYVVAGFDPALPPPGGRPHLRGQVTAIAVADTAKGPMRLVEQADALAGRGLSGDRYAAKAGTFTPAGGSGSGYDLTLIEAEALDELELPGVGHLAYAEARRNVVTRGIDLNALVGRRFRIGDVECIGQRLCEPCAHLERLTTQGRTPRADPPRWTPRRHRERRSNRHPEPISRPPTEHPSSSSEKAR